MPDIPKYSNQLIHETSPYLLQHAHNPVDWYPWGDEALDRAKKENRPILISIGYAACHWCHVMERESFEDVATAAIMNEHFINIKIDREERPDLDHIYMDAVQAIAGSGGWPLNVFLTPDGKPFYGGTYFPPQRAYNRPSWQETLLSVIQAFRDKRHEIDAQAENLTEHLLKSNAFGMQKLPGEEVFSEDKPDRAFQAIMQSADKEWGGFGKAPKFPQTLTIQFLLHYGHLKNIEQKSGFSKVSPPAGGGDLEGAGVEALKQALLSLDKMIEGGIYDQVGGGFSRYSTDTEWLAPHFEKMLYDNALLIAVVSEAYQLTKKERYKEVIEETIHFVERELMHPESGFYAALDADSEGVEGKFYVWDIEEVNKILGKDAVLFCECYDITPAGNWSEGTPSEEKKNILRIKKPVEEIAAEKNLIVAELKIVLKKSRQKLIEIRNKRIRPQLDDKIILGWNALMNTACSKAFGATGHETYRQLAISNMQFLLKKLAGENPNEFHHTWKNDKAKYPAFLDDYAFLIEALLQLYEITGNKEWLIKAKELTSFVIGQFSEEETGFFFYTPLGQDDLIIRKKEIYDGAIPSGNSTMAYNLYRLSVLFDQPDWKQRSLNMIAALGKAITQYPTSFGNWVCLLLELITGTNEIVLIGEDLFQIHQELLEQYIPHKVVMLSPAADPVFPLLVDKPVMQTAAIYLCRNYTCHPPVNSAKALISLINNTQNG